MLKTPTSFLFRDAKADEADLDFIVNAFDSTIPHLAAIGSTGQWGPVPWSKRPSFREETLDELRQSEHYCQTGKGVPIRVFIAEVEVHDAESDEPVRVPVALAMVNEDRFDEHLKTCQQLEVEIAAAETKKFLFLKVVLTDFRECAAKYRAGAGARMIDYVKEYAQLKGKEALYLDCWSGGSRSLKK